MPSIRHVVVLMLENRSFDHMLGFLGSGDGLTGAEFNRVDPADPASVKVPVTNDARYLGDFGDPAVDPSHEYTHVNMQIYNSPTVPATPPAETNIGFVKDYASLPDNDVEGGKRIMKCFDPQKLPVLSTLAREFALCDRWFSSVPGQTWPNRFFVHAATSGGSIDNQFRNYPMKTIFDSLTAAQEDWTVYFHDMPQCVTLGSLRNPAYKKNFKTFQVFFALDCQSGSLPSYSFIEPRYFDFLGLKANDQHPPHDVALGEQLIADVYETIRNSPVWQHTLLVVTYDEHGGMFDHVLPPDCVSPDGLASADPVCDFRKLGLRVPAIIVSPFVAKGTLDHTVYDHTSVPATVKEIFDLPAFLTARDRDANTFTRNLTNTLRTDTPTHLPRPPAPIAAPMAPSTGAAMDDAAVLASLEAEASHEPLSEFQVSLIETTKKLEMAETPRERGARLAQLPRDEHDGAVVVRSAFERFIKGAGQSPPGGRSAPAPLAAAGGSDAGDFLACIDRRATPPKSTERMALVKDSTWAPGQILRIRFLDGDPAIQARVQTAAAEWMRHANIQLAFGTAADAPIRISFQRRGSWSYVGRECLSIDAAEPTMNFGWLRADSTDDEVARVVLHEFGHALGCIHEHNHPLGGIQWNKDVVYEYYAGPPNFWTKEKVDTNLFATYDKSLTVFSTPDPESIMMYPIDPRFTTDGMSVGLNKTLSPTDIAFIKTLYPF